MHIRDDIKCDDLLIYGAWIIHKIQDILVVYLCVKHDTCKLTLYDKQTVEFQNQSDKKWIKIKCIVMEITNNLEYMTIKLNHISCALKFQRGYEVFINKNIKQMVAKIISDCALTSKIKQINLDIKNDLTIKYNETDYEFLNRLLYGRAYWYHNFEDKIIVGTCKTLEKKKKPEDLIILQNGSNLTGDINPWGYNSPNMKNIYVDKEKVIEELYLPILQEKADQKTIKNNIQKPNIYQFCCSLESFELFDKVDDVIVTEIYYFFTEPKYLRHIDSDISQLFLKMDFRYKIIYKFENTPKIHYQSPTWQNLYAKVVSTNKEIIDIDPKNRIYVNLPFDKKQQLAPVRLANILANQTSTHFIPMVGTEVLITWYYTEPIAIASMYNDVNQNPLDKYNFGLIHQSMTEKELDKKRKNQIISYNKKDKEKLKLMTDNLIEQECNQKTVKIKGEKKYFDGEQNSLLYLIKNGEISIINNKGNTNITNKDGDIIIKCINMKIIAQKNIDIECKKFTINNTETFINSKIKIEAKSPNISIIAKIKILLKSNLKIDIEAMILNTKALMTKIKSDVNTTIESLILNCKSTISNTLKGLINSIDSDILVKIDSKLITMIKANVMIHIDGKLTMIQGIACIILANGLCAQGFFRIGCPF